MANVFGVVNSASNIASSGSNIANTTLSNLGGAQGTNLYWKDTLRPASFRSIKFGVFGSDIRFGRRNVLHQYPYRDTVWVEDMGRSARRISMEGFLVGADVIAQRDQLIAACESPGDGKLVHPTLGERTVSVMNVEVSEQWDHGRVFRIRFSFIEGSKRIFPSLTASTAEVTGIKAAAANLAASNNFASRVQALRNGAAAVKSAVNTANSWARKVQRLMNDATNIKHLVQDAGNLLQSTLNQGYGRRFDGGSTQTGQAQQHVTQQQITGAGSAAVAYVNTATNNLIASANALSLTTTDAFAIAVQTLVAAIIGASANASDGLRLIASAAIFDPVTLPANDAVGIGINEVANASGDLFRRSAVIGMAIVSSSYQPLSYEDAAAVRSMVVAALDNEIDIAGDQDEDETFNALFDLRTAVSQDLTVRGANLAHIVKFNTNNPISALVEAYRLYDDIGRADELIRFANPVHPAFMPTSQQILSS